MSMQEDAEADKALRERCKNPACDSAHFPHHHLFETDGHRAAGLRVATFIPPPDPWTMLDRAEKAEVALAKVERIAAAGGRLRSASYNYSIACVDRDAAGMARADAAAKEAEADLRALGVEP